MNDFMIDVFAAYGVPREDAAICADVLLESDRRGIESHGCNRFKPIYLDRIEKGTLLPVTRLDFMHEISWGGPGVPENGHPWTLSDWMIAKEDFDFYSRDWRKHPYFERNAALEYLDKIGPQFDGLLLSQGYRHERSRFFCDTDQAKTIAVFSHGGSGACVLSHLLALPFPYVCTVLPYEFTSIIILEFPVRKGEYVHPRIELFNDAAHIMNIDSGLVFQQKPDEKE